MKKQNQIPKIPAKNSWICGEYPKICPNFIGKCLLNFIQFNENLLLLDTLLVYD